MRIQVVGCNHKTAPLEIRERVAFDDDQVKEALRAVTAQWPGIEAMLVSTCNRVEFYVARKLHGYPRVDDVLDFVAKSRGLTREQIADSFFDHQDMEAVSHLMGVTSSLDSMVLGETQILGQVRHALSLASEAGTLGPILTRLGNDAVATGKRVHSETELSSGRASIASVAVQFARQIFEDLSDKTLLLIGAGKMGEQTLARLVDQGPQHVLIVNRSPQRGQRLADAYNGQAMGFDKLTEALTTADIVVTSTAASEPILDVPMMEAVLKARRYRPIFLIDIAVPRDVDERVGRLGRVYLYNIDDLQKVVAETLDGRAEHVTPARQIVDQRVEAFMSWFRSRDLAPTIAALRQRVEGLGGDELGWVLPKLSGDVGRDRELVEQFARRLINKLLHDPIRNLGQVAADPEGRNVDIYIHAITQLFNLSLDDSERPDQSS